MYNYRTLNETGLEFLDISPADQLGPGERMFVEVEGRPVVIFNIAGEYFSIGDVCSHDDGPVGEGEISGYSIACQIGRASCRERVFGLV